MIFEAERKLRYSNDSEELTVEAWGRGLRVRAHKTAGVPADNWALLESAQNAEAVIKIDQYGGSITNGNITAIIDNYGILGFYDRNGNRLLEEFVRNRKGYNAVPGKVPEGHRVSSALEIDARQFRPLLGGDYELTMRFESAENEKIFGLGQYQQPVLDMKGCELELAQRNSQASVPFAVSSLGYGFLWNNPAVGRVTFGKNVTAWFAGSTKVLDYWITAGDTPSEILQSYAGVTGTVPMMPDWAMGFWQCKLRYQTQEELLEVAREYKRRGVPLDVIVADYFHWTLQGEWKFDPDYWPDPQAMVDELDAMGVKLMVSFWPNVDNRSENFREMREKGYLIRSDRGHRIAMDFLGNTAPFDATNPKAREYVWNKAKENYYKYGVRIFWLDESEPEYTYYDFDNYRYYLGPNVQIGNIYPMLYARGFYDGMSAEGQTNIINLIRCAWAGSQRYGALVWSGDVESSFRSLRSQLAAGLSMGMAGIPWWTTDIGGFHGGNPDDPAFRECFTRWFQWAAFCPVMRLHGDRQPHTPPLSDNNYGGGMCDSGAGNEIWSYGPGIYGICKDFIGIRRRLLPYIRELMREAHEKGSPVMRPLFYEMPEDNQAWHIEDEYMFGSDILVAPVLYAGARSRKVYLPGGNRWKNLWTGEMLSGGSYYETDAPIEQIPVFAKEASGIELH